ncbi:hypothetical protein [Kineosporia sp. A_224]|uniref:hypothetical protein n=1 Tax=Kineosporia sp. A_224 TaxID=1962180 RepID=UPI000B4BE538|nr:hypothetical protein [Kineosporia sp. A_224]
MRWSVSVVAEGDRVVTREEVVELADAVAGHGGIASGLGTPRYGAQLVVEAGSREDALTRGRELFADAAGKAGLPAWPVVHEDAVSEDEDDEGWDRPA